MEKVDQDYFYQLTDLAQHHDLLSLNIFVEVIYTKLPQKTSYLLELFPIEQDNCLLLVEDNVVLSELANVMPLSTRGVFFQKSERSLAKVFKEKNAFLKQKLLLVFVNNPIALVKKTISVKITNNLVEEDTINEIVYLLKPPKNALCEVLTLTGEVKRVNIHDLRWPTHADKITHILALQDFFGPAPASQMVKEIIEHKFSVENTIPRLYQSTYHG